MLQSESGEPTAVPIPTSVVQPQPESSVVAENIGRIRSSLPDDVTLVCVTKYQTLDNIKAAYAAGEREFAESRVQELLSKKQELPEDIHWHFIGHLQTNKVREIVPFITLIQSVDSERLLQKISDEAERIGREVDVLLEVHVAAEESKTGFTVEQISTLLKDIKTYNSTGYFTAFPSVRILGLMCMASNTDDEEQIRSEFETVSRLAHEYLNNPIVSMGMSEDYKIAIQQGSNMVRIGSALFE